MSSLLEQASLVITPNAYKEGKLYGLKGTDLDVVRATTATRVNESGLIETVANNVPRLDYTNGSCPSILVEPQRTNLLLRSEEFDNAIWSKSECTITSNLDLAPNGTMSADRLVPNETNNLHRILSPLIITTIGQSLTVSFFVKKNDFDFFYYREGIGSGFSNTFFNISNGTIGTVAVGRTAKIEDYNNGWYRCSLTTTASTISSQVTFGFSEINNVTNFIGNNVKYNLLWGAQLEVGSNATSYIPTVASAVTRNADVISKTGIADLIGQTEGTMFVESNIKIIPQLGLSRRIISLSDNTISNSIELQITTTNQIQLQSRLNGVILSTLNTIPNLFGIFKIAGVYSNSSAYKLFVNGNLIASISNINTPNNLNSINLGDRISGNDATNLKGNINSAILWKTALTDQECINLTTL